MVGELSVAVLRVIPYCVGDMQPNSSSRAAVYGTVTLKPLILILIQGHMIITASLHSAEDNNE